LTVISKHISLLLIATRVTASLKQLKLNTEP